VPASRNGDPPPPRRVAAFRPGACQRVGKDDLRREFAKTAWAAASALSSRDWRRQDFAGPQSCTLRPFLRPLTTPIHPCPPASSMPPHLLSSLRTCRRQQPAIQNPWQHRAKPKRLPSSRRIETATATTRQLISDEFSRGRGGSDTVLADIGSDPLLRSAKGVIPILLGASPELSGGWGRGMQVSYKRVPVVRKTRCTACGLCGSACPHDCLGVLGGSGTLVQPDACTSEGQCVTSCRQSAIQMRWVRLNGNRSIGQWRVRDSMLRQPQRSAAPTSGCED
jgi:Pyruvate/2-oxoacid:ferredoxin oxidoreductase delta subunit